MQYGEILTALTGFILNSVMAFFGAWLWVERRWILEPKKRMVPGALFIGSSLVLLVSSVLLVSGAVTIDYSVAGPWGAFYESVVTYAVAMLFFGSVASATLALSTVVWVLFHDWTVSTTDATADAYLAERIAIVPAASAAVVCAGVGIWLALWLVRDEHAMLVVGAIPLALIVGIPQFSWLKRR